MFAKNNDIYNMIKTSYVTLLYTYVYNSSVT